MFVHNKHDYMGSTICSNAIAGIAATAFGKLFGLLGFMITTTTLYLLF